MSDRRTYCAAAARAIREIDRCSLGAPEDGRDEKDWRKARLLLWGILERNGYDLSINGRLRNREQGHR
jgi:hypothetical protein